MTERDLHAGPPRRWSEEIGGICWLPRLIDKTRAALAGTLGDYLFGQSPMDRALLRALGLSHREFAAIVRAASGDDAVLSAVAAHDLQAPARARAWSAAMPPRNRAFLWLLDVDDGYRSSALVSPVKCGANAMSRIAKWLWPSRAAEPPADAMTR